MKAPLRAACAAASLLALAILPAPAGVRAAEPAPPSSPARLTAEPVPIPGGEGGIGFDDLGFSPALGAVLAPAGRTGALALVDPASRRVTLIPGFSASMVGMGGKGGAGHGEGTTSADFVRPGGRGLLFAIDRTARRLDVVDPHTRRIVGFAPLGGSPDYVRWVAPAGEVWVTEPDAERIEVFRLPAGAAPKPVRAGAVEVPGGPEALVVDASRGRAYSNLWKEETVAIDIASHAVVARWKNGCAGSRGLALDGRRGFLFVGCAEGKATVLDVARGTVLDSLSHGDGVDIIAYDPAVSHLYLPGGKSATLAVLAVSAAGKLSLVATAATAPHCHCVTVDDRRQAWLCDPAGGRLLVVRDTSR
jgi:hypothetical protein